MKTDEKPRLKPANENPWYCLATLYGEHSGEETDQVLLKKNRDGWSQWRDGQEIEAAFANRTRTTKLTLPERTQRVDFTLTHFEKPFIFEGYHSNQYVDFSSAKFSNRVDFTTAVFGKTVSFSSTVFSESAKFERTTFLEVDFSCATFLKHVDFSSAVFSRSTEFVSATFSTTNFNSAEFHSFLDFSSAKFKENADFRSAIFHGIANFSTTFFNADFSLATFKDAHFTSATFESNAYFRTTTFSNDTDFRLATFSETADFVNATFESNTSFADATFKSQVPDFRGATLHEATEWHDVKWPPKPLNKNSAQAQVYRYERLKQEMERLKKHEDEQMFFAKELRARRKTYRVPSMDWLLNSLYKVLSDYGQSVKRPFSLLLLLIALGTGLVRVVPPYLSLDRAAGFSAANIFPFLQKREMTSYSGPDQTIGFFEALIGLILLFLLGLALRNKFRMK
jgi:uncharacterized protein YjbI with pentapeptide repeats